MILPEIGYTPANLRALLEQRGLTRDDAARLLGVKIRAVHRWCAEPGNSNHRDMSLLHWRALLQQTQD